MRRLFFLINALAFALVAWADCDFDRWFDGSTLRLDYILAGDDSSTSIYFEEASVPDTCWAGRRKNLNAAFLRGNGQVIVCDKANGDTIYVNSFSTLFQEWQHTPEASSVKKAFEFTCLVPFPRDSVDITIALFDNRGNTVGSLSHIIDPNDILIRRVPPTIAEWRYVHKSSSPDECVDIAIVAEGYTEDEKEKFFNDANRACEALFSHEPFKSLSDRFNVIAVATLSGDSGPDVPHDNVWNRTAHRSHFDTFYSQRYLTTQAMHGIHDGLSSLPYEHIILLVNTPIYGGGGIFNHLTTCSSDHPTFKEVLVHEFGHAYGGLADEYFYNDDSDTTYPLDVEPWEPNISTLVDFSKKWKDMVPGDVVVPTPSVDAPSLKSLDNTKEEDYELLKNLTQNVGVYEGAGYRVHGIYRPVQECRMKVNEVDFFCPVCSRAIIAITDWYTR